MSTIWTPSGERPIRREEPPAATAPPPAGGPAPDSEELTEEELAARMADVQRELLSTPAGVVITNHCIGLFQLAALHLGQPEPDLVQAQLAVDALAAVVESLGPRLGDDEAPLRDALTNLRLAFVEARRRVGGSGAQA
ncbi:MAG: hypothetical protein ABR511_03620 [Acidimicrobiales bacterium]